MLGSPAVQVSWAEGLQGGRGRVLVISGSPVSGGPQLSAGGQETSRALSFLYEPL